MIEPIICAGIGFLLAGALFIGLIPAAHARAVRLTRRRIEAMAPLSMAEIQAGKDRLRAQFAMSTRRLETSAREMTAEVAGQLARLGKKSEAIGRLRLDHGRQLTALLALEARKKALADALAEAECALAERTCSLQAAELVLADTSAALSSVTFDFHQSALTVNYRRVETVVLRAQREVLKGRSASYQKETEDLRWRIAAETAHRAAANHELAEERGRTDALVARVAGLERALMVQSTRAEILTHRVQELEPRLAEQARALAQGGEYAADLQVVAAVPSIEVPLPSGQAGQGEGAALNRPRVPAHSVQYWRSYWRRALGTRLTGARPGTIELAALTSGTWRPRNIRSRLGLLGSR